MYLCLSCSNSLIRIFWLDTTTSMMIIFTWSLDCLKESRCSKSWFQPFLSSLSSSLLLLVCTFLLHDWVLPMMDLYIWLYNWFAQIDWRYSRFNCTYLLHDWVLPFSSPLLLPVCTFLLHDWVLPMMDLYLLVTRLGSTIFVTAVSASLYLL